MEIKWKDDYSVGIKEIDDQHKYFIGLLNDLFNGVVERKTHDELKAIFDKVAEYADMHFATEEKYFDEFHYENADEHKLKHREMRDEIKKIRDKEFVDGIDFDGNLVYFLTDWLKEHLEKMDRDYKQCFLEHGLK